MEIFFILTAFCGCWWNAYMITFQGTQVRVNKLFLQAMARVQRRPRSKVRRLARSKVRRSQIRSWNLSKSCIGSNPGNGGQFANLLSSVKNQGMEIFAFLVTKSDQRKWGTLTRQYILYTFLTCRCWDAPKLYAVLDCPFPAHFEILVIGRLSEYLPSYH